jgi:hypothetical protein
MKRFSTLRPEEEKNFKGDEVLYKDPFIKLIKFEDWTMVTGKDAVI